MTKLIKFFKSRHDINYVHTLLGYEKAFSMRLNGDLLSHMGLYVKSLGFNEVSYSEIHCVYESDHFRVEICLYKGDTEIEGRSLLGPCIVG